jgi:hypothetical protein
MLEADGVGTKYRGIHLRLSTQMAGTMLICASAHLMTRTCWHNGSGSMSLVRINPSVSQRNDCCYLNAFWQVVLWWHLDTGGVIFPISSFINVRFWNVNLFWVAPSSGHFHSGGSALAGAHFWE